GPPRRPRSEPATAVTPSGRVHAVSPTLIGGPVGGSTAPFLALTTAATARGLGVLGGSSSVEEGASDLRAMARGCTIQLGIGESLTAATGAGASAVAGG